MSPILMDLTPSTDATFTSTVVIAGVVIVMAVLFLLILIFQLFGVVAPKINDAAEKREKKKTEKNEKKAVEKASAAPETANPAPAPAPAVEYGINGEIVAAISAAVAQLEGGSVVIRSIKRKNVGSRNPWANAANIENTRPF